MRATATIRAAPIVSAQRCRSDGVAPRRWRGTFRPSPALPDRPTRRGVGSACGPRADHPVNEVAPLHAARRSRGDRVPRARHRDRQRAGRRDGHRDHRLPRPIAREPPSRAAGHRCASAGCWSSAGLCLLPRRRLVASRWREPFFMAWSATVVGSIAVGVVIEGRPGTPLLAGFILPMIFAAISYPVLMTAIVAAFMLVSAAAASAVTGQSSENTTFLADGAGLRRGDGRLAGARARAPRRAARRRARPLAALPRRRRDDDRRHGRGGTGPAGQPPQLRGPRLPRGGAGRPRLVRARRPRGRAHGRAGRVHGRARRDRAGRRRAREPGRHARRRAPQHRVDQPHRAHGQRRRHAGRGRGRHRAADRPGARAAHGLPRRAHRPGQPRAARRST